MNLEKILAQYDAMFGTYSLNEIEKYLADTIAEAKEKTEMGILVTLLNEIIGFCRDTTQREKALNYCDELQEVLKEMHLEGRIDYATSLLNVANAYRAFGLFEESLYLYEIVESTYKGQIASNDFMYASLYNNWSLLYQEMKDYEAARDMLKKALDIADSYENAVIPQATTRANLAATLLQIGTEEAYQEAIGYLKEALAVHEKDGGGDFHYGAVLVAMGDAYSFKKDYENAALYYEKGLSEIEKHVGRTDNYARVLEKYEYVKRCIEKDSDTADITGSVKKADDVREDITWVSNLERCRAFYETYGKAMIHGKFSEYEDRIAVGLVGEGSDCFGFDDEISTDHDYELGFCMWLTEADFKKIGEPLQKAYAELIAEHVGRQSAELFLSSRRGVFTINNFYSHLLGIQFDYEGIFNYKKENCCIQNTNDFPYEMTGEYQLAASVNGEVFADAAGFFSAVREQLLEYYPDTLWCRKLAQSMHEFSQYAQSNYARMMARKDVITAQMCIAKAMEAAMDLVYLLGKTYAPYYKWKRKGLEKLQKVKREFSLTAKVLTVLEKLAVLPVQTEAWEKAVYSSAQINKKDECVVLFEQLADAIVCEMKAQNLIAGDDNFLEAYIGRILVVKETADRKQHNKKMEMTDGEDTNTKRDGAMKTELVEKIVELEWKQFDKVKNEGGRASCQDDYTTFSIMRKSQYLTWTEELLESYYNDLVTAQNKGWNLIMEKYARMMESTAPEKYEELNKDLPQLSDERIAIQEEIIKIQVGWMEEFATKFPKMAGTARSIHTSEDTAYNTSYETYLRGEMGTYSEKTFILYGRFITGLLKEERNLAYEIMENTAKLYGYDSVETAEAKL